MSYWFHVEILEECPNCKHPIGTGSEVLDINMTSNVSGMWTKALTATAGPLEDGTPRRIRHYEGMHADVVAPAFMAAAKHIRENRAEYEELNPSNGWGDVDGALEVLDVIASKCEEFPASKLTMSY